MRRFLLSVFSVCLLSSCEKKEEALVLPPPTGASHAVFEMGADYEKQIYFDFETGQQVFTSLISSWDLAFEASPDGCHVFMNSGKNVFVHNTHAQDIQQVKELPTGLYASGSGWSFDYPCGLPDSTGIGEWYTGKGANTKGEVYIVQTAANTYQKMRILSVNSSSYLMEWMPLNGSGTPVTVQLPKDAAYNYVFFSFTGGIVKPEPPKDAWDVVFTRYRHVYPQYNPDGSDFPYPVKGVLLNPYQITAARDSITSFDQISLQQASAMYFSPNRDAIGYNWKSYTISTGQYRVDRWKNYIIRTRKDQLYKMHFLDFYNSTGIVGIPSIEYERLK